jgi:O-antigen/teichoic acid export membrane protein
MNGNLAIFMALTVSGIVNFAAIALYSRLLSPAEYGVFAVIMAGITLLLGFLFAWVDLSLTRFVAVSNNNVGKKYISSFILLYAALLVFAALGLAVLAYFDLFPSISPYVFMLVTLAIIAEVMFSAINIHTRLVQMALVRYAISVISRSILAIAFAWYFLLLGYSYTGIIVASVLSFLIPTCVSMLYGKVWRDFSWCTIEVSKIKEITNFGVPLVAVMVIQSAISATDRLLLSNLMGAEDAGQYSVSQDLVVKLFIFLLAIIHKILYPFVISKYEQEGFEALQCQLKHNIVMLLTISIPAVFALSIYARNIVEVILGEQFRVVATNLMPYQVVIALLNCLVMFYIVLPFNLLKRNHLLVGPGLIAFISNVVVGYFAIEQWGMFGAIVGSFIAYSLYFYLSWYISRSLIRLPFPGLDIIKILCAAMLMSVILIPLSTSSGLWPLILIVVIGGLSYTSIILMINVGGYRSSVLKKLTTWSRYNNGQ